MERIETGKRVGAAVVHVPDFADERHCVDYFYLSHRCDKVVQGAGKKEYIPSRSADGISRSRGRSPVAGRTHHLSLKLMLTVVKTIPLLTTIVTHREQFTELIVP